MPPRKARCGDAADVDGMRRPVERRVDQIEHLAVADVEQAAAPIEMIERLRAAEQREEFDGA